MIVQHHLDEGVRDVHAAKLDVQSRVLDAQTLIDAAHRRLLGTDVDYAGNGVAGTESRREALLLEAHPAKSYVVYEDLQNRRHVVALVEVGDDEDTTVLRPLFPSREAELDIHRLLENDGYVVVKQVLVIVVLLV